jgi:NADH:ubiquinone oxidoreductase subunit 6 (subunit J)
VDRCHAWAPQAGDHPVSDLAFYGLAACLLAAAVAVVAAKSLFRAAFALSFALVATAGFYLLLTAPLLAAVQILLYTGGVLTLVVFALVVAGANTEGARWRKPVPAALLALAVFVALAASVRRLPASTPLGGLESGKNVGLLLFGDYLVPFELLSVLLLGAVFGALLVARKDRPE